MIDTLEILIGNSNLALAQMSADFGVSNRRLTNPIATYQAGLASPGVSSVDGRTGAVTLSDLYASVSALSTHAALTTAAHGLGASAFHADNYFALSGHDHGGTIGMVLYKNASGTMADTVLQRNDANSLTFVGDASLKFGEAGHYIRNKNNGASLAYSDLEIASSFGWTKIYASGSCSSQGLCATAGDLISINAGIGSGTYGLSLPNLHISNVTLASKILKLNAYGLAVAADPTSDYQPFITAGTTAKYWRGDKSWQTLDTSAVPENTNLYFTNARVTNILTASAVTIGNNAPGTVDIKTTNVRFSVDYITIGSTGGGLPSGMLLYTNYGTYGGITSITSPTFTGLSLSGGWSTQTGVLVMNAGSLWGVVPGSNAGLLRFNGDNTYTTTTLTGISTAIQKGNGSGYLTPATAGIDFIAGGVGTAGTIAKFSASGVLANSSFITENGTGVGIGGSASVARLYVTTGVSDDNVATFYQSAAIGHSWGLNVSAGTNSSDAAMRVSSQSGASYLYVRGDGNVGIGTTSPGGKFQVTGTNYDMYIDATYANTINFGYTMNGALDGWINHKGYAAGTTQFRGLSIGDGKSNLVAYFDGTNKRFGVGTGSPIYQIHSQMSSASSNNWICVEHTNSTKLAGFYAQVDGSQWVELFATGSTGSDAACGITHASVLLMGSPTAAVITSYYNAPLILGTHDTEALRITNAQHINVVKTLGFGTKHNIDMGFGGTSSETPTSSYVELTGATGIWNPGTTGIQIGTIIHVSTDVSVNSYCTVSAWSGNININYGHFRSFIFDGSNWLVHQDD